jgi:hypothetical protein
VGNPYYLSNLDKIALPVLTNFVFVICFIIGYNVFVIIFDKLFGGKGAAGKIFGGISKINMEIAIISTIILIVTALISLVFEPIKLIDILVLLALGIYGLAKMIDYNALVNEFSNKRSLLIMFVLPIVISLILSFVLVGLFMPIMY